MIKAVIYDLDDTMVNSDPLHARAWEELLKEYGHSFRDLPEQIRSGFIGMRVVDIVKEIAKYLSLDVSTDVLYKKRIELFLKIVEKELQAMPGLQTSLELLKNSGYKLAIASSGAKKYIELVLKKFNIKDFFEVVVTGDDVHIGKPHPETYIVTCKMLGLLPSECLVLEDATKGIESAKSAGCICVAVENPNVPKQDYPKADLVIQTLNKLTLEVVQRFDSE